MRVALDADGDIGKGMAHAPGRPRGGGCSEGSRTASRPPSGAAPIPSQPMWQNPIEEESGARVGRPAIAGEERSIPARCLGILTDDASPWPPAGPQRHPWGRAREPQAWAVCSPHSLEPKGGSCGGLGPQ